MLEAAEKRATGVRRGQCDASFSPLASRPIERAERTALGSTPSLQMHLPPPLRSYKPPLLLVHRREEVRVIELTLVNAAIPNRLQRAVVDPPVAGELPAGLDTLA